MLEAVAVEVEVLVESWAVESQLEGAGAEALTRPWEERPLEGSQVKGWMENRHNPCRHGRNTIPSWERAILQPHLGSRQRNRNAAALGKGLLAVESLVAASELMAAASESMVAALESVVAASESAVAASESIVVPSSLGHIPCRHAGNTKPSC